MNSASLHRFLTLSSAFVLAALLSSASGLAQTGLVQTGLAPAGLAPAGLAPATLAPAETNFPSWVTASHLLEARPFDPEVNRDAEIAIQELASSPDFHTPLCSTFFALFNGLTAGGYPYQAQVYRLYTLGSATYRIETGKTDSYGTNLYAFTSVLKGYSSMIKKDPNAHNKTMDELLITDIKGKLPERLKKDSTCR